MVLVNILLIRSKADRLGRKSKLFCDKDDIVAVELPVEKLLCVCEITIGSEEANLGGWRPQQLRSLHGRLGKVNHRLRSLLVKTGGESNTFFSLALRMVTTDIERCATLPYKTAGKLD